MRDELVGMVAPRDQSLTLNEADDDDVREQWRTVGDLVSASKVKSMLKITLLATQARHFNFQLRRLAFYRPTTKQIHLELYILRRTAHAHQKGIRLNIETLSPYVHEIHGIDIEIHELHCLNCTDLHSAVTSLSKSTLIVEIHRRNTEIQAQT